MVGFREAAKKLLNNNPEFNFSIQRNAKTIGKMQGITVNNTNYLHVLSATVDIEIGDSLINGLNQMFIVSKTELISGNILRIHFR